MKKQLSRSDKSAIVYRIDIFEKKDHFVTDLVISKFIKADFNGLKIVWDFSNIRSYSFNFTAKQATQFAAGLQESIRIAENLDALYPPNQERIE